MRPRRAGLRPASRHQIGSKNPGFSPAKDLCADARTGPSDVAGIAVKHVGICILVSVARNDRSPGRRVEVGERFKLKGQIPTSLHPLKQTPEQLRNTIFPYGAICYLNATCTRGRPS